MVSVLEDLKNKIHFYTHELIKLPEFITTRKQQHAFLLFIMLAGNLVLLVDRVIIHGISFINDLSASKCLLAIAVIALAWILSSLNHFVLFSRINRWMPVAFMSAQIFCYSDFNSLYPFVSFFTVMCVLMAVFYCDFMGFLWGALVSMFLCILVAGINFNEQMALTICGLLFIIPISIFINYSNLYRYSMMSVYGRLLKDENPKYLTLDDHLADESCKELERVAEVDRFNISFEEMSVFLNECNLLVLIYNEKGILKWNRTFDELYGGNPKDAKNFYFETFVTDAHSHYGSHFYKDVEFHFQREYVFKRFDGSVISLLGEIENIGPYKMFVAMDNSHKQLNEAKLEKHLALKDAMIEINQAVIGIEDIYELLELIVEKTVKAIPNAAYGSALQLNDEGYMQVVSQYGFPDENIRDFKLKAVESFLYVETQGRLDRSILIDPRLNQNIEFNVVKISSDNIKSINQITATISSPLLINGQFFGSLNVDSDLETGFTQEDIDAVDYIRKQVEVALSKHKLYEEIIYLARYDELTDVFNRRYFESQLKLLAEDNKPFCLVLFDISHLRSVNDTYGHAIGDAYIKKFAKTLAEYFGEKALIGRYGGDEFVAAFRDIDANTLITRIEVLNILFAKDPMQLPGHAKIHCQFHYGISEYPLDSEQLEELVSLADRNLRHTKGH